MLHLKKLLCMILTVTLLLSVMVMGAGAAFNDENEITHKEAVEKMASWNIIKGTDSGNFDPKNYVTRGEMCKMICLALNGGKEPSVNTKSTSTYWDTRGHWAEGYIEYCDQLGIVAGSGNGEFHPNSYVTTEQAAKMMLIAMGYKPDNFTGTKWNYEVSKSASDNKLYSQLASINVSDALCRDDAAQLIFNGIMRKTVEQVISYDENGNWTQTQTWWLDDTIYSKYFQSTTSTTTETEPVTETKPTTETKPSSGRQTSLIDYIANLENATTKESAVYPYEGNHFTKISRDTKDKTYYKIDLKEGEGLAVALKAQINSGYMSIDLYDSNNKSLGHKGLIYNDNYGVVEFTAKQDMTIYACVTGESGIYYIGFYGAYFNNNISDSDRDFFGSLYTAQSIELGTFSRELKGQEDWYRVYVNEGQTLTSNISPSINKGYMNLDLYDSNGKSLKHKGLIYDSKTGSVEKEVATSGYYMVKISGDVGKYNLTYSIK